MSPNVSQSPTITTPAMTQAGMILGTPAYMTPEQARGRPVDKRADIWAFGCVLFEMLTGRSPFAGETISDTIARTLEREPEWQALPASTPAKIRELLRRCLQKDGQHRLQEIADARIEIEEAQTARIGPRRVVGCPQSRRGRTGDRYRGGRVVVRSEIGPVRPARTGVGRHRGLSKPH